jgi:hypothetical protein
VVANEENDRTPMMWRTLARLFDDLAELEKRIAEITREIDPTNPPPAGRG